MPPKNKEELQNHEKTIDPIQFQRLANQNGVAVGVVVSDKRINQGAEKMKNGQLVTDGNGVPLRYPDTFYATLDFMGGSIETKITPEQYQDLLEGGQYSAKGRLKPVNVFGDTQIQPVFSQFVLLAPPMEV